MDSFITAIYTKPTLVCNEIVEVRVVLALFSFLFSTDRRKWRALVKRFASSMEPSGKLDQ